MVYIVPASVPQSKRQKSSFEAEKSRNDWHKEKSVYVQKMYTPQGPSEMARREIENHNPEGKAKGIERNLD